LLVCFFKCGRQRSYNKLTVLFTHTLLLQRLNFIDVATGSLGQGLSCAAGMAYTGKYFDKAE